jgi:hypothetical protein
MALDTANKRGSALSTARGWLPILPVPDGAIGQADRQQAAWCYAGILAIVGAGVRAYASTMFSAVVDSARALSSITSANTTED